MNIRPVSEPTEALLKLNNDHAKELSLLTEAAFGELLRESFYASCVNEADALLIAFDENAKYDNPNYRWFLERYKKFVYIDRVVTAAAARGRGYGRALYEDLFQKARKAGHEVVTCEINVLPPNPVSDAFHQSFGFEPIGQAELFGAEKTVRYWAKSLQ